jgi:hypothetical protein
MHVAGRSVAPSRVRGAGARSVDRDVHTGHRQFGGAVVTPGERDALTPSSEPTPRSRAEEEGRNCVRMAEAAAAIA